jgi:ribose 5-phosphate isomerase B
MHVTAGHAVVDSGAVALTPGDDYPDFVIPLARAVAGGKGVRGGAICDMGGADHINIIRMGGRTVGSAVASDLVETLLASKFSQAERHPRRLGIAPSKHRQSHRRHAKLHRVVPPAASL